MIDNVPASIQQLDGSKQFDGDVEGDIHMFNTVFIIREVTGFGYNCRIVYKTNKYEILSIKREN